MKFSKFSTLLSIFLFALLCDFHLISQAEQKGEAEFRMGYTANSMSEVDIKDAAAAIDLWVKEIAFEVGVSAKSYMYNDPDALIKDLQISKLDMGIMRTTDYLNTEHQINADLALGKVKGGKKTVKEVLLVRSDTDYSDIKNLRNKNVAILRGDEFGDVFLSSLLIRRKLSDPKHFFNSLQEKNKPSNVILAVFFKQADACITTDTSLDIMIKLNPQIGDKTKIIASSPDLIPMVSVMRKDYNEINKQKAMHKGLTLNKHPRGQQVLLLFQGERLETLKKSDLDSTRKFMNDFKRLTAEK